MIRVLLRLFFLRLSRKKDSEKRRRERKRKLDLLVLGNEIGSLKKFYTLGGNA